MLLGYLGELAERRGDADARGLAPLVGDAAARASRTRRGRSPSPRAASRSARSSRPGRARSAAPAMRSRTGSGRSARRSTAPSAGCRKLRSASDAPQPQPHVLHLRRHRHQLPAARRQRVDLAVLAQQDEPALRRGGERRLAQRPVAVVGEVRDRPPDVAVADAAPQQLVDDHGLGDVLDRVHVRVAVGLRGADVAPARPLADRVAGHAGELSDLTGREVPVRASRSWPRERYARPGLGWQARAGVMRCGSVAPTAGTAQPPVTSTYRKLTWPMPIQSPSLSAASLTRSPVDEDAVEAPVVEQHGAAAAVGHHGVTARHRRVVEQDVGCGAAADMQALPIAIAERVEHELSALFGGEIAAGRRLRRGSGRLQTFLLREGRERAGLLRRGLRAEGGEGIGHGRNPLGHFQAGDKCPPRRIEECAHADAKLDLLTPS